MPTGIKSVTHDQRMITAQISNIFPKEFIKLHVGVMPLY